MGKKGASRNACMEQRVLHSDDAEQYRDGVLPYVTLENRILLLSPMHGNACQLWNRDLWHPTDLTCKSFWGKYIYIYWLVRVKNRLVFFPSCTTSEDKLEVSRVFPNDCAIHRRLVISHISSFSAAPSS